MYYGFSDNVFGFPTALKVSWILDERAHQTIITEALNLKAVEQLVGLGILELPHDYVKPRVAFLVMKLRSW